MMTSLQELFKFGEHREMLAEVDHADHFKFKFYKIKTNSLNSADERKGNTNAFIIEIETECELRRRVGCDNSSERERLGSRPGSVIHWFIK
jgi:hypothetical protein